MIRRATAAAPSVLLAGLTCATPLACSGGEEAFAVEVDVAGEREEAETAATRVAVDDAPMLEAEIQSAPVMVLLNDDSASPAPWLAPSSFGQQRDGAFRTSYASPTSRALEAAHTEWLQSIDLDLRAISYPSASRSTLALWTPERLNQHRQMLQHVADAPVAADDAVAMVAVVVTLTNLGGGVADLRKVTLEASSFDPHAPGHETRLATLRMPTDALEWQTVDELFEAPVASGSVVDPGATVSDLVFSARVPHAQALAVLEQASGLTITARYQDSEGGATSPEGATSREGAPHDLELATVTSRPHGGSTETTAAASIEVILDYDGLLPSETYQVSASGSPTDARQIFADLDIPYTVGHSYWQATPSGSPVLTNTGLVGVRTVSEDASAGAYFLVAVTHGDDPQDRVTDVYHPHRAGFDFGGLQVHAGDVLHVAYIVDRDRDGLAARTEAAFLSSDTQTDTDGDRLSDAREVIGWLSWSDPAGPAWVFSSPATADTDGDGTDDWNEWAACTDPSSPFRFGVADVAWRLVPLRSE